MRAGVWLELEEEGVKGHTWVEEDEKWEKSRVDSKKKAVSDLDEDVSVLWQGQKADVIVIVIEVIAREVGMELGYNCIFSEQEMGDGSEDFEIQKYIKVVNVSLWRMMPMS